MSKRVLDVIALAKTYKERPSNIVGDMDTYTAFCFDEACLYIQHTLENVNKEGKPKKRLYFDEDLEKLQEQSQSFLGGLYDALEKQGEVLENG